MGRPLSICLCTTFYPSVGGIETLAEELADRWAASGHRVVIISNVLTNAAPPRTFPYRVLYRPSARQVLHSVHQCDVFVHNNVSLKSLWPLLLIRRPFVAVHHSTYGIDAPQQNARQRLKVQIARRWAHNISVSHAVQRMIAVGGAVILNSYDDNTFTQLPVKRDKDIVFVGRLVSDKGVDVLLRALSRLRSRAVFPTVSIVGEGPERLPLQRMVEQTGLSAQVTFCGLKDHTELPRILNQHRIMVVPSTWKEPFGIVALEGAACGCVVVGSSGGGLPEAIGPCGVTFPNANDERLAEVLEYFITDPAQLEQHRLAAPLHLSRHKADVISAQYIDSFVRAIADHERAPSCES